MNRRSLRGVHLHREDEVGEGEQRERVDQPDEKEVEHHKLAIYTALEERMAKRPAVQRVLADEGIKL